GGQSVGSARRDSQAGESGRGRDQAAFVRRRARTRSNPNSQEFTEEELRAAVEEANSFGLRVAAHAHSAQGIKNAINAGVASVEHATMIDDEGIHLAKQR